MLFYKVLPTQTYVEKTISGAGGQKKYLGLLKDRISLFICANASGKHKIPLTMLSDAQNPPSFVAERQKLFPYMKQENAWADPKSLLQWWKEVFLPHIRDWTSEKVLLVLQKPSIVDLDDPQEQVTVKFLPPILANNHNNTDGLSVSSFFEPPLNMLSVVKTKYRYSLLKEVFNVFEEREKRREVAQKANLETPGLRQGELPHLQDCMRILNTLWEELPSSMISSSEEDGDGKKKRRRRRRKKKVGNEVDTIENEVIAYTDEMGTDELIKDIVHFFRRNTADINTDPSQMGGDDSLDKSVAEVQRCFLTEDMQLKTDQDQVRKVLEKWIGLEESQDIRGMLQFEILASMKFRLIIGVDGVDKGDDKGADETEAEDSPKTNEEQKEINEDVAMDCATQLLQCAVRLSKEHPAFHSLASQLIEASDSAFVALREAKNPTPPKVELTIPKKRKPRVSTGPRKKRAKADEGPGMGAANVEEKSEQRDTLLPAAPADTFTGADTHNGHSIGTVGGSTAAYHGDVFQI